MGTWIETGGFPQKYDKKGDPEILSDAKPTYTDDQGVKYIIEKTIKADYALIKAWKADTRGNLIYRGTANNFNQDMAKSGKFVIAEVEEIVDKGELDQNLIITPSIYVDAIVKTETQERPIEFKTNSENTCLSED